MKIDDLISKPITGIRAFNELPIDALIWTEAHDQHHLHRRVHHLAAHRPGIIYGLEVILTAPDTVVVAPGVAIDSAGQTVVLSEAAAHSFKERGQCYLVLQYKTLLDADSAIAVASGKDHYRLVEAREIAVTKELPSGPYLELARIFRTGAEKPVREAANPFDPSQDELNLLHRLLSFPHCYADIGVAELGYTPRDDGDPSAWKPNRAGLVNLVRWGSGAGFHLEFLKPHPISQESQDHNETEPTLLYMAGRGGFKPLTDAELAGPSRFLSAGGTLLGEACGGSPEFEKSFKELAGKVGATLRTVEPGHPLLTAHNVFPAPPPGANGTNGTLLAADDAGVLFSTFDYGGAWMGRIDGGSKNVTETREKIRQAQEWGLNIIAWAARRRRVAELKRLRS